MKKKYFIIFIVMMSVFSTFLVVDATSAEGTNKVTSHVGIQFYGEQNEKGSTVIEDKKEELINFPKTGEKKKFFFYGVFVILLGIFVLYKKSEVIKK